MIGFKKQFCLLIAFLIGSTIFLSCDKQNDKLKVDKKNTDTVIAKSIEEKNQSFSELKVKDTEKFNKYYIIGRINENEFIVGSTIDNTTIGIYDDKADSFKVIQRPKIKDNHFFDVVYDNGWLVWSENKDAAIGPEDAKGFNWLVVAKNITSGEERIIDKAKYTEKQFNVPQTYYYCPIYLSINNGYVVYRASDKRDSDGKLINKVMLYSLASDKLSTLSTSDEMDKEAYLLTSTDGKKVMWLHLKERNKAGRFFYNYNDIDYYDIATEKSGKVDLPFKNLISKFEFDSDDVYISMEKNIGSRENDLTDRLVKFSIKDKSVVDLLPADEDNCASLSLDRNGYISWENNNQYNYKMYDYKNNKIINVIDKEKLKDYNHVTYTVKDGILNVSCDKDGNGQVTTQYYDLSKKKN